MPARHYLACDLGAESGRLMLGRMSDGKLDLEELHRFPNDPVKAGASLHWNIPHLARELKMGLRKAAQLGIHYDGISTDSWGVDYLLFDEADQLIEPTFHYRDPRADRGVKRVQARISWPELFARTGIQFMPMNTIYQLAAETQDRLTRTRKWIPVGDGFNYLLSGVNRAEASLASTTQLYDPVKRAWSRPLLEALDLPPSMFPPLVDSGSCLGPLLPEWVRETGLDPIEVIASCSHDTGAAVVAVPATGSRWAYISSGTWSLMGVEWPVPVLTDACRELNVTNEIGYGNSVRLLKNIVGLWLVQECRRDWEKRGRGYDYGTLTQMAANARPFHCLIDPSDPRFLAPDGMPAKIAAYCRETDQPVPNSEGEYVRCALESLALLYRQTARQLEGLTGQSFECLHIVGGGSKNGLLNQFAANALQIPVYAGPVEATANGNILVQALARQDLPDLEAARAVVAESSLVTQYSPADQTAWDHAADRFAQLSRR